MNIFNSPDRAAQHMNRLGGAYTPFIFMVDFEMKKIIISTDLDCGNELKFDINGVSNHLPSCNPIRPYFFDKFPISFEEYNLGFDLVKQEIQRGNSFLLNLAYPTRIVTDLTLEEIYDHTKAKYKVLLRDDFVCYSPEIFVQIADGKISSNPMKGTIDADMPDAEESLLDDKKEIAEHYTIVDLIRNDLSQIAKTVTVDRFRYVDRLQTSDKELLQVSSEISGTLPDDYCSRLGEILFALLPAGSITGAPKKKTLEIIQQAEGIERGYYTGICGIFDGRNLDSGVMIRYIEQSGDDMSYRSGCGITSMSEAAAEYQEMIDKVYLPLSSTGSIVGNTSMDKAAYER